MASLGFVVVAVLLASVAAAPAENTTQDVTTSTEKPTEEVIKCTFTDFGLKFAMKSIGVIAEDGRFIESGAVSLMDVLESSGLFQDQKHDKETVKQAAKACNPVLNNSFVDSCKRPMQIAECLSAEYDKITSKRS